MKQIAVTGSIAYDHLLTFDGEFKDSLLASELENLSVSFLAQDHKLSFGGCGGNIAYNLKMLGVEPLLFGVAGNDFGKYEKWLKKNEIGTEHILVDEEDLTSNAYVLTDRSQRQIAIFSPGTRVVGKVAGVKSSEVACAIIGPDVPERMMEFGREFAKLGIKYIFDPGQAIPGLSKAYLAELLDGCIGLILNEYEAEMICSKMGLSFAELVGKVAFLVKTVGEKGAELYEKSEVLRIPAVAGLKVVDITGCGDAFRGGFLSGFVDGKNLATACAMGNTAASFALEVLGTQNHKFPAELFSARLKAL